MARHAARARRAPGRRRTILAVAALLVTVTACSAADMDGPFPASEDAGEGPRWADDLDDTAVDEGEVASPAPGADGTADLDGAGPQLIRTAVLTLEVADATTASDDVTAIARARGGYVAESDLERDAQGIVRGTVVLRVPSAELDATVAALDELAVAVPVRRIEEADVTGEVVDLRARIANLTAYETELTALLGDVRERTARTDDLLAVFQQVQQVRSDIDRLQAQLDALSDRVALSTVTVTLRPAASAIPVTDPTWSPGETLRDALSTTVDALTSIADVAIRVLVTVVPILMVLAFPTVVATLAVRRVLRRRRTGSATGTRPPTPPMAGVGATRGAPPEQGPEVGPDGD